MNKVFNFIVDLSSGRLFHKKPVNNNNLEHYYLEKKIEGVDGNFYVIKRIPNSDNSFYYLVDAIEEKYGYDAIEPLVRRSIELKNMDETGD